MTTTAQLPGEPCPGISTYDVTPNAYRAGTSDFNGADLENDPDEPPDFNTFPTAALLNTICLQLIALGKVTPSLIVSITGGTTPAVAYQSAAGSGVANVTPTRNSAGNVTLAWTSGAIPPNLSQPMVTLNVASPGSHSYTATATLGTNGESLTVVTYQDGTPTDLSFTVAVY